MDRATGHFKTYRHRKGDPRSLSLDQVFSVMEDSQGRLWIGTEGGGLDLFEAETETFKSYRSRDGLASDTLLGEDSGTLLIVGAEYLSIESVLKFDGVTTLSSSFLYCSVASSCIPSSIFDGVSLIGEDSATLLTISGVY